MNQLPSSGDSDSAILRVAPRIHLVGRKNSGKTTLLCELLQELNARQLKVASIKHTHHHHELDTPGKDSHRHREAGAAAVGILSPQMTAVFMPNIREASDICREGRYKPFETAFSTCDLILVEGDLQTSAPRLEVWRSAVVELPYAAGDTGITAVVTDDDSPSIEVPLLPRNNIAKIADFVLSLTKRDKVC